MHSPRIARPMCISMYAIHVRYMYPRDTYHDTRIATAQVRNTIGYDRIHLRYVLPMYPKWIRHVFYVCILRARHNTYLIRVEYTHDTYPCQIHNTIHPGIHVYYMFLRTYYAYLIPYHLIPPIKVCLGWRRYRTRWKRWKGPRQLGCRSPHCWRWSSSWRQYVFQYVFHMYSCTDLELEVEIHMDTKEYMWIHDDTPRYTGYIQNT